jgi:hypothetical protein
VSATVGAAIYIFTAFVVVQFAQSNAYLLLVIIGSWIRTYGSLNVRRWWQARRS